MAAPPTAADLRYYEAVGVLPEPPRVSGQRRYGEDVLERLAVLQVAQQAGFSLEDIAAMLRSSDHGEAADEIRALAARKLPEVRALIERAERVERWLELAAECQCGSVDLCGLFNSEEAPRYPI